MAYTRDQFNKFAEEKITGPTPDFPWAPTIGIGLPVGAFAAGFVRTKSGKKVWDYYFQSLRHLEGTIPMGMFQTFHLSEAVSPFAAPDSIDLLVSKHPDLFKSRGFRDYLSHATGMRVDQLEEAGAFKKGLSWKRMGSTLGELRVHGGPVIATNVAAVSTGTRRSGFLIEWLGHVMGTKNPAFLKDIDEAKGGIRPDWLFVSGGKGPNAQAKLAGRLGYAGLSSVVGRMNLLLRSPFELEIVEDLVKKVPILRGLNLGVKPGPAHSMLWRYTKKGGLAFAAYKSLDYADYLGREYGALATVPVGALGGAAAGFALGMRSQGLRGRYGAIGAAAGGLLGLGGEGPLSSLASMYARLRVTQAEIADTTGLGSGARRTEDYFPGLTKPTTLVASAGIGLLLGGTYDWGERLRLVRSIGKKGGPRGGGGAAKGVYEEVSNAVEARRKALYDHHQGRAAQQVGLGKIVSEIKARYHGRVRNGKFSAAGAGRTAMVGAAVYEGFNILGSLVAGDVAGATVQAAATAGAGYAFAKKGGALGAGILLASHFLREKEDPEKLRRIYRGEEKVAVRSGRWWEAGRCNTSSSLITLDKFGNKKRAEEITLDDSLLGADGNKHRILKIYKRKYIGAIVNISTVVDRNIDTGLTTNHIVPIIRPGYVYDGQTSQTIWQKKEDSSIQEMQAGDIEVGDFVQIPCPVLSDQEQSINLIDDIKVGNFLLRDNFIIPAQRNGKTGKIQRSRGSKLPCQIDLSPELGRLIGYFLAEGNLSFKNDMPYMIETVHAVKEDWIVEDIKSICQNLFSLTPTVRFKDSDPKSVEGCWIVRICSSLLARIFFQWFYSSNRKIDKQFPSFCFGGTKEFRENVILGYWRGDGHLDRGRNVISSTRLSFIEASRVILLNLGYCPTSPKKEISSVQNKNGSFSVKFRIGWKSDLRKVDQQGFIFKNEKLFARVIKVEDSLYEGFVYDFEIDHEDHLLQNGTFLVHNSPYEGKRPYFRPHRVALMRSGGDKAAMYGSESDYWETDSFLNPLNFLLNPYAREELMWEQGYKFPVSRTPFEDAPVLGPVLAATIGRIIKPPKMMGRDEWISEPVHAGPAGMLEIPREDPIMRTGLMGTVGEQAYRLCLTEDSKIRLSDGTELPINEIQIGDRIWGHESSEIVENVFVRNKVDSDRVVSLSVSGQFRPLKITDNHIVYALQTKYCSAKRYCCIPHGSHSGQKCLKCQHNYYKSYSPEWVPVKDLKKQDFLVEIIPKLKDSQNTLEVFPLLDEEKFSIEGEKIYRRIKKVVRRKETTYTNYNGTVVNRSGSCSTYDYLDKSSGSLPLSIDLDWDFGWLCGYTLAEGSLGKHQISYGAHINEVDTCFSKVSTLLSEYFEYSSFSWIRKKGPDGSFGNGVEGFISHTSLSDLLKVLLGSPKKKKIHPILLESNPEFLLGLLHGFIDGDFHIREKELSCNQSSRVLQVQLTKIFNQLGIIVSNTFSQTPVEWKGSIKRYNNYGITLSRTFIQKLRTLGRVGFKVSKEICFGKINTTTNFIQEDEDFVYLFKKIVDIQEIQYEKKLYDLEIRNTHIYYAEQCLVHNSELVGLPGFALQSIKESLTGTPTFFERDQYATPSLVGGAEPSWWSLELGGLGLLCIPEGSPVQTDKGIISIEDVNPGDAVISRDSEFHIVKQTSSRQADSVIKVNTQCFNPGLEATPNHVIPVYEFYPCHDKNSSRCLPYSRKRCSTQCSKPDKSINVIDKPLEDIKPGDFLEVPLPKTLYNNTEIDLLRNGESFDDQFIYYRTSQYFVDALNIISNHSGDISRRSLREFGIPDQYAKEALRSFRKKKSPRRFARKIVLDSDLCYVLGWYTAEGCISGATTQFTLHIDEEEYAEEIGLISKTKFGASFSLYKYPEKNTIVLHVQSLALSRLAEVLVGKGSKEKKLAPELYYSSSDCRAEFLRGYILGDGFINYKKRKSGISTSSRDLAVQSYLIGVSLGFRGYTTLDYLEIPNGYYPQGGKRNETLRHYVVWTPRTVDNLSSFMTLELDFLNFKAVNKGSFVHDGKLYVQVKSTEIIKNQVTVYDLEISDLHYFTAQYISVHNSEGIRRYIPHRRNEIDYINPLPSDLPSWLPGKDSGYFLDFSKGDIYTKLKEPWHRLPGKGLAALNPELKGVDPEYYSEFWRFKVLSDVAPWSSEYNTYDRLMSQKVADQRLTAEQMLEVQSIRKQVNEVKKARNFQQYKYGEALERQTVRVTEEVEPGVYLTDTFGSAPITLAGIETSALSLANVARLQDSSLTARESVKAGLAKRAQVSDFLRDYIYPGAEIDVFVHKDPMGLMERGRGGRPEVPAVVSVGGTNLNRALVERGLAQSIASGEALDPMMATAGAQRMFGQFWENLTHGAETPLESFTPLAPISKFVHQRTAIEDYERSQVYGRDVALWQKPISHFLAPGLTTTAWWAGWRGIPREVQERYMVDEYFDRLEHEKWKRLRDQAYAQSEGQSAAYYQRMALKTKTGADPFSLYAVQRSLSTQERAYFREFVNSPTAAERRRISQVVSPQMKEILHSQWTRRAAEAAQMRQEAGIGTSVDMAAISRFDSMRNSYAQGQRDAQSRASTASMPMPGPQWAGWDPNAEIEDYKVKTILDKDMDAASFGVWRSDISRVSRRPWVQSINLEEVQRQVISPAGLRRGFNSSLGFAGHRGPQIIPTAGGHRSININSPGYDRLDRYLGDPSIMQF